MATEYQTVYINKEDYKDYEKLLSLFVEEGLEEKGYPQCDEYATIKCTFSNGYKAYITIVCGDTNAYIDPVLYDESGEEVDEMEVPDSLLGEYQFELENGNKYICILKVKEE